MKKSHLHMAVHCILPFIWHPGKDKTVVIKMKLEVAKVDRMREAAVTGEHTRVFWGGRGFVLNSVVGTSTWTYTCVRIHKTLYQYMYVNFKKVNKFKYTLRRKENKILFSSIPKDFLLHKFPQDACFKYCEQFDFQHLVHSEGW